MRTVTLELLRHGPAHNQLLSPLTPYLALCENHAAVTLHVPFEHNQFLHRLTSLNYKLENEARIFQLADAARAIGDILGSIPGLTAEANKQQNQEEPLTHLRLIISASELALLPFELAVSPSGFPGAGQHLLLQPQMPLCLTREIRRAPAEEVEWPERPKILFAAAAPPGVGTIPLESHLLVLRRVIRPWVKYYDASNVEMRRRRVEEHLVFLPSASIEEIERCCASGDFTHVHILAHGVERRENFDTRFFLALHKTRNADGTDYISGERLATALRASRRPDGIGLARPVLVTLASCNSADGGSVAGAGSSIAHALHEAGIPMVVAGQFPLSFEGSVRLLEVLYEGVLWGADPRQLLHDVRRRLYAQFPDRHDWASVTAYASLPANFEGQLSRVMITRAIDSVNASMNHADEATRRLSSRITTRSGQSPQATSSESEIHNLLVNARRKMTEAKKYLERLVNLLPHERPTIYGYLASTEKRQAEALYSTAKIPEMYSGQTKEYGPEISAKDKADSMQLLQIAREHYWTTFMLDRERSWAVVQYLSLTVVLSRARDAAYVQSVAQESARPERDLGSLWSLARLLSLYDLHSRDRKRALWAYGNLVELDLLSLAMPPDPRFPAPAEAERRALEYTNGLLDTAPRDSFNVYSMWRQIVRYLEWYNDIADVAPLIGLAELIFQRFPVEVEDRWR